MAGDPALAAGVARLFTRPFVCGPLLVGRLAALACDLALFASIHRSEPAVFLSHDVLPPVSGAPSPRRAHRSSPTSSVATPVPQRIDPLGDRGHRVESPNVDPSRVSYVPKRCFVSVRQ